MGALSRRRRARGMLSTPSASRPTARWWRTSCARSATASSPCSTPTSSPRPGPGSPRFYLKMKGDYHRYLAEFQIGSDRKKAAEETLLAYKQAQDIALDDLAPTH